MRLLEVEQVEIRILIKALLARLVPYCDHLETHHLLLAKLLLKEDELQFALQTLVACCEVSDPATMKVKVWRLLELIKDLATYPANHKAFLNRDIQSVLLGLACDGSKLLTEDEITSCLSSSTTNTTQMGNTPTLPESSCAASLKSLLSGMYDVTDIHLHTCS